MQAKRLLAKKKAAASKKSAASSAAALAAKEAKERAAKKVNKKDKSHFNQVPAVVLLCLFFSSFCIFIICNFYKIPSFTLYSMFPDSAVHPYSLARHFASSFEKSGSTTRAHKA